MTEAQVNRIRVIFFMTYSPSPVKTSLAFTTGVSCLLPQPNVLRLALLERRCMLPQFGV
jgi:hypothetical protein